MPMDNYRTDLKVLLDYIDPAACSYQEWCNVGMALKYEGYSPQDWEDWSKRDPARYHDGECARKWNSFHESSEDIVTGGTIYQMAVEGGFKPQEGQELDWNAEISAPGVVVQPGWTEDLDIEEPKTWRPGREAARYLEALFEPGDVVGYVMKSRLDKERGKYIPSNKGVYTLTAGKLLEEIAKAGDDLGAVFGDYDREAGAWIRFNPLDGKDVRNTNVTEYRYALVESDSLPIGQQASILKELELPIAAEVYSGGKSIHAIVRIDATDYKEYQKRVEKLYSICEKNGLVIDKQNKNPSRLSRLPGCDRGNRKQFLIATNTGKGSWAEWEEWIEAVNDNLPDVEDLSCVWDNLPELAEPLIDGILRKSHKMLIAGPSKAGKSFLQIELAIAIAEGRRWLGRKCEKGRVMYVNLELDRASCLHRFKDVYTALGIQPENLQNIDVWNLRGKSVPLDKLSPMLIRRAQKKNYVAVIIDPIYKVITGDENSAEQMAKFCNQFDRICAELGCATIYCHHHSKGNQGSKKAMDRASGSGVFARDPDAQLDMIELELTDNLIQREEDEALCRTCRKYLETHSKKWQDELSEDDLLSPKAMISYCENTLKKWEYGDLKNKIQNAITQAKGKTAWRLEATLREFPNIDPINVWFDYPVHKQDPSGALNDISPEVEPTPYERMKEKRDKANEQKKKDIIASFEIAFSELAMDGEVRSQDLADSIGISVKQVNAYFGNGNARKAEIVKNYEKYQKEKGGAVFIRRKSNGGAVSRRTVIPHTYATGGAVSWKTVIPHTSTAGGCGIRENSDTAGGCGGILYITYRCGTAPLHRRGDDAGS